MEENTIFQEDQSRLNQNQKPANQVSEGTPNKPLAVSSLESAESSGFSFDTIKTILKIVIGIIIVAVVGFAIYSFASSRFTSNKNEKATLTYWGLWEDSRTMQGIISDFERENPNIKVSYSKQDVKEYKDRLKTRIQNGTGPDIFRFHNTWVIQLLPILSPLSSDVIDKEDFKKWFYPVIQSDMTNNGAIYGIPVGIDTLSLFINKENVQAAGLNVPTTWEDFLKAAKMLTVKDENGKIKTAGVALGTFDNITHAPDIISLFFVQNGADVGNLTSTSKNASDALDFYVSFAKGEANVWDATLDPSILAFSKGNLAMYFGYSWDIFTIKAMNPNLSFEVVPVPHLPGRNTTVASYWAEGVSVKSKYQKEAMLFMKFLTKKETEQKLFSDAVKAGRIFGEPYARTDLQNTLKDNKLLYPFVSQANEASSSFFASDTYDNGLNYQMNNYLGNAIRSILDNTSPQTAVETLAQGVAQVLQQYVEPPKQ